MGFPIGAYAESDLERVQRSLSQPRKNEKSQLINTILESQFCDPGEPSISLPESYTKGQSFEHPQVPLSVTERYGMPMDEDRPQILCLRF